MKGDYERIERAIHFIQSNISAQPKLEEVAAYMELSPFHFQRLFRRWAGVSPKRFLEYLTVRYAKDMLNNSCSILDASYDLGLTSAGRLHDHFVSIEAISPGEYKTQGIGVQIHYGIHPSPFGKMLLAQTYRGVCSISFVSDDTINKEIDVLHQRWPNARIIRSSTHTAKLADKIFTGPADQEKRIHLTVRGTNFQINVWKALLKIPPGQIRSYQQLATHLEKPAAYRAVANAIAANPVGFLIPCHRVLRGNGDIGGFRWGKGRKQAMLAWEAAKSEACHDHSDSPVNVNLQPKQKFHG